MLDDLLAGAGRLAQEPPLLRQALARQLLGEAHAAHHYMRRTGRPHPRWGNGSLMARALGDSRDSGAQLCLDSLAVMAAEVARFRRENSSRGHGLSRRGNLC
jgi:hypothetical protein